MCRMRPRTPPPLLRTLEMHSEIIQMSQSVFSPKARSLTRYMYVRSLLRCLSDLFFSSSSSCPFFSLFVFAALTPLAEILDDVHGANIMVNACALPWVKHAAAAVSTLVRLRALMMDESRIALGEKLEPKRDTMDPRMLLGEIGSVVESMAGAAGIRFALFVILPTAGAAAGGAAAGAAGAVEVGGEGGELCVEYDHLMAIPLLPIVGDANRIVNIALNLCNNAVKHATGTVEMVRKRREDAEESGERDAITLCSVVMCSRGFMYHVDVLQCAVYVVCMIVRCLCVVLLVVTNTGDYSHPSPLLPPLFLPPPLLPPGDPGPHRGARVAGRSPR